MTMSKQETVELMGSGVGPPNSLAVSSQRFSAAFSAMPKPTISYWGKDRIRDETCPCWLGDRMPCIISQ